ncbi:MAG: methylated-DNA--[protein]-cysteine S-methyltransferase [Verrucomicrobia bacterium]|jgi:AraC family transcriptional regulator, regulatory protein of adaptative response / methylated-DNA-[protein]-cysteine methyltransferase|nr:methylated-DNA--[protein]-cysteine S-methyltransferase [Verrucomicrobiota bacterium]
MNDYERIARVIRFLVTHFREQPDLDTLAKVVGLSPHYFHRIFTRMAGTTPKGFVQHLTLVEAGKLLRQGAPVLNTTYRVGLSGPGRLHDLCLKLEAASPGEIRSGGLTWVIRAGYCITPFGTALIAEGPRGVCKLSFVENQEDKSLEWMALKKQWPKAKFVEDNERATEIAESVFTVEKAKYSKEPLKFFTRGTDFQIKVWRALIEVPRGDARTYGDIAKMVGSADASRAVGRAIGCNPIGFIIPCHRVIYATGTIGNYRWGTDRKKSMLALEQCKGVE